MSQNTRIKKRFLPEQLSLSVTGISGKKSDSGDGSMLELPVIEPRTRKPDWLRVKLPYGETYRNLIDIIDSHNLHTVCQSARCPNMGECWTAGTATFMILGNVCTRSCGFCAVQTGRPVPGLDMDEPRRVAEAARLMNIRHAVITSVNRDERKDGGAPVFAETMRLLRETIPGCTM